MTSRTTSTPTQGLNRRRFLRIIAGTAGGLLCASVADSRPRAQVRTWRGVTMGAEASITIGDVDLSHAEAAIRACTTEVARLEALFSLQRPNSCIARLNATGRQDDPPADFCNLVREAQILARQTAGAFDATVQPLWLLYRNHFARGGSTTGPAPAEIARACALVGSRRLHCSDSVVNFEQAGMALSLNGIAQGYITDRVADLLRDLGLTNVLVDLGEYYASGSHPEGRPWRVGIRHPANPLGLIEEIPLANTALSTSGGYGLSFDVAGRFHHLFDPHTGLSASRYLSVSVQHPRATIADGLSTAFSAMPLAAIRNHAATEPALRAWIVMPAGELIRIAGGTV